jgi:hypothetical protein
MMSTSQHNNVVGYVGAYMKNNALWVIMEVSPECFVCRVCRVSFELCVCGGLY